MNSWTAVTLVYWWTQYLSSAKEGTCSKIDEIDMIQGFKSLYVEKKKLRSVMKADKIKLWSRWCLAFHLALTTAWYSPKDN